MLDDGKRGLGDQDRLFRGVFARAAEATLVVDPRGDHILAANPAACRMLGYDETRLMDMRFSALHPHQLPSLIVFTDNVLAKGQAWTRALSPQCAGGGEVKAEYSAAALQVGGTDCLIIQISDLETRQQRDLDSRAQDYLQNGIAQWRRVEMFFQEIEQENRLILSAAGEGIYGVNADGRTTFVNPAAEQILGWPADELIGRDIHTIVHHTRPDGSHYPAEECPIYAAFRDGSVHKVDNEVFWGRDGKPIWVEYTSTPIRDRSEVVGAVIVFRDISERREAQEKLRAALAEVDSLRQRLELENAYLQEEIRGESNHHEIIGRSGAIQTVLRQIELVAPTDATVLITGESGTGKELIARAIHEASGRRDRPLIRVNCAAIPRELFESEFFGHVRGAFTGAVRDRIGRFELADGGTLFLDEVGEIPLELQGKLLRVLQEGHFERVGEERTREVNVRLIAATNRELKQEVRRRRFREDLYFRLNVFPLELAPLRERLDDVPLLATHFLGTIGRRLNLPNLRLTQGDIQSLSRYEWPGNVRELENVIERAAILSRGGRLRFDLSGWRDAPASPVLALSAGAETGLEVLTEAQRRDRDRANISAALQATQGKVFGPGGAAELLGMKPTTLASRIKALGLRPARR